MTSPKFLSSHSLADGAVQTVGEDNDCTVKALAAVTGWSYTRCHDLAAALGRKRTHYFNSLKLLRSKTVGAGFTIIDHSEPALGLTLARWLKTVPLEGHSYYLRASCHAFAVVDGVVVDFRLRMRCRILNVFELIPKVPA